MSNTAACAPIKKSGRGEDFVPLFILPILQKRFSSQKQSFFRHFQQVQSGPFNRIFQFFNAIKPH